MDVAELTVLTVNIGSSSVKLRVLGPDDAALATLDDTDSGVLRPDLVHDLLWMAPPVDAVGHRVVHGGPTLTEATRLDDDVHARIADAADLAPLHNQPALDGIDVVRDALPDVPHVACFDTAFHAALPDVTATYALPADWRRRWGLRRYGFHGLSHSYAAQRAAELLDRDPSGLRVVSCHLGSGASLCAVNGGWSVDTTMGFTPMEGLVMATRSGSVDPGMLLWLLRQGLDVETLADGLEHRSGLAGLAELRGGSGDMRDVRRAADAGEPAALLALDVYGHRLCQDIAAMTATLGGLDVLVFTGGVGEHDAALRADVCARLGFLGVGLDEARNADAAADREIGAADRPVRVVVVASREDLKIAAQTRHAVAPTRTRTSGS